MTPSVPTAERSVSHRPPAPFAAAATSVPTDADESLPLSGGSTVPAGYHTSGVTGPGTFAISAAQSGAPMFRLLTGSRGMLGAFLAFEK